MSNSTTTVSLYIKLALAVIKGDDAEATAIKIQKKAIASITAQIAAKVYNTLNLEEAVEAAETELAVARVNGGELITKNEDYIRTLLTRKQELKQAQQALVDHKEDIEFLQEELETAKK